MKPIIIVLIIAVCVVSIVAGAIYFDARSEREWLEFSAQHHCSIVANQSAFQQTLWQCDGFQVKH